MSKSQQKPVKNILIDTPGQIEVFVWSASGSILLDSLASTFPTVLAYIIDTPRTSSTSTFMSNMLYACSILYKTKLPMILVFNKTDVKDAGFAKEWMTDFEAFQAALKAEEEGGSYGGLEGGHGGVASGGSGYMGSLLNSMSLMLEEFYKHLSVVGVSSMTGQGVDEFFQAVNEKVEEFKREYTPELERRRQEREKKKGKRKDKELGRLLKDMRMSGESSGSGRGRRTKERPETVSDVEDDDEQEDDIPAEMVDPDDDENEEEEETSQGNDGPGAPGLTGRYKHALRSSGNDPSRLEESDEHSFARYLNASSMK